MGGGGGGGGKEVEEEEIKNIEVKGIKFFF